MSNTRQNPPNLSIENQANLVIPKTKEENSSKISLNTKQNIVFKSDYSNRK